MSPASVPVHHVLRRLITAPMMQPRTSGLGERPLARRGSLPLAWRVSRHDRGVGIAAVSAGLFGLVDSLRAVRASIVRRRLADDWLRTATGRVIPSAYAWRAAQLVSAHERCVLARTLRRILAMA